MKRFLIGIATFVMMAVLCVVSAGAETYGGYEYTVLDDGTVEITDYTGLATDLKIPSKINGKKVTSIGGHAFYYCSSLTSVTIPDGVTSIGEGAFRECYNLTSVTIPDSVTSIGGSAFWRCFYLETVTMPDSIEFIGGEAFHFCESLTEIDIPEGLTAINEKTFQYCKSLSTITIPDGVTSIGRCAFDGCSSLTTINIPDSVESICDYAFHGCSNLTDITIPDGITSIDYNTFEGCTSLTAIIIPDSVTSICSCAFYGCESLTSIIIPNNVTSIGESAFNACSSLKKITVPDGITNINPGTFSWCESLEEITLPDSVTYIDEGAFSYCPEDFLINCYKNTYALEYAVYYNHPYNILPPKKVTGFSIGGRTSNALRLNWTANITADGYIIEQYKNNTWTQIANISDNSTITYRVTGLTAGTVYKFRIKAYDVFEEADELYSDSTSTLSACTKPANVTGLKLGGRASNALRLNWTKNTSADGYIVEQYKSGKWVRIAKITSNATTTYRVTGLKASTQYKFRVKAYKMSGSTALYSGYTSTLAAYTNPSNVTNLKITGKAGTALRLGWSKNTSADGYIVEMYKGGKWVRAAKISSNATVTYRKAGLTKGTTYKFRVRTYNMVGKTALYGGYVNVSGTTNK